MSVDINRLTAHLSPQQQADVAKAYHREAEHSTTAFLYCFFLGIFGVHRFYLGQWRKGIAHLVFPLLIAAAVIVGVALTWSPLVVLAIVIPLAAIALVWEIIDLFTIDHEVNARNLKLAEQLIAGSLLADHSVERAADNKLESALRSTEAQAAAARTRDQAVADAASATQVGLETAAVAEPVPGLVPGNEAAIESVGADSRMDAGAALSTDEYVSTTTTQISADPNETESAQQPHQEPESWSDTERYHSGAIDSSGTAEAAEATAAIGGALAAEEVSDARAAVDDVSVDRSLTRSHEASGFSVTDSAELVTTVAAAASVRDDQQALVEEETPLTLQEAEAPTWPDHEPVHFDEPAVGAAATTTADPTDLGNAPRSAETIADVEGTDASPLYVSLPQSNATAATYFDQTDRGTPDAEAIAPIGEPGEGLVVFVPGEAESFGGAYATNATPAFGPTAVPDFSTTPPADSYIPPTVPVITAPAEPESEGLSTPQYEAAALAEPSSWTPAAESEPAATSGDAGGMGTLAELAGGAALGVAGGAAYEEFTHHEARAAESAAQEAPTPTLADEPYAGVASTTPDREPATVLPDAAVSTPTNDGSPEAAAALESLHHRKRHIRVVRQVRVGGEVIEEMAAEEYIDEDADPEPVRKRLEAMLRQRAGGAISEENLPGATGGSAEG